MIEMNGSYVLMNAEQARPGKVRYVYFIDCGTMDEYNNKRIIPYDYIYNAIII